MAKAGDRTKVRTKKEEIEGILMPSFEENIVMIKLDNGYNMGFEKKDILEVKILSKKKEIKGKKKEKNKEEKDKKEKEKNKEEKDKKEKEKKIKEKGKLPLVSILHCGGTIASKVDYETGAVKAKFSPEEILEMFPELGKIVNLRSKLVANMLSENIRFAHYNLIAKEIFSEVKKGAEGIIVTHGTDALHYTAAALAFILEDLGVPVIFVGAQRSSDRGSSDAFLNLKCAASFIANSDFGEVGLCMHSSSEDKSCLILPACKSRKLHSSRRDAFKVVNGKGVALVSEKGEIKWLDNNYSKKNKKKKLKLKLFKENLKIGLLKAHPQMFASEVSAFLDFDGLVLEGTGLGHLPVERYDNKTEENEKIFNELKKLARKIPLVMTSQTIFGGVNMNVYSPGRKLIKAGVLGNGLDITSESALIKLGWLLSNHPKKIKELWEKDLRGELGRRRSHEEDFLEGGK